MMKNTGVWFPTEQGGQLACNSRLRELKQGIPGASWLATPTLGNEFLGLTEETTPQRIKWMSDGGRFPRWATSLQHTDMCTHTFIQMERGEAVTQNPLVPTTILPPS